MSKTVERIALPSVALGTKRELTVHRYGAPGARPRAYLQAALHADEHPGLLTLNHLIRMLDEGNDPVAGEIVIVPVANPIGLSQQLHGYVVGRYDFSAGVNFNRDFPDVSVAVAEMVEGRLTDDTDANAAAVRKALAAAVEELPRDGELKALRAALLGLSMTSDIVLDLHCDLEALVHIYSSHHHRDIAAERMPAALRSTRPMRAYGGSCASSCPTTACRWPVSPPPSSCAARPMSAMRWPPPMPPAFTGSCSAAA
jgi:predicted deacylase